MAAVTEIESRNLMDRLVNFFIENEGELVLSHLAQLFSYLHLLIIIRSTDEAMVSLQQSHANVHNSRHIFVLLSVRRPTMDEESETISAQKHFSHLQFCADYH